ncbi:hypothetical protein GIB67_042694, partial [Kingdonia uniflora]
MQDLTMSSVKEEYDGTDDEEEFESDEGEVATTSAQVGFKCRSVLVKLREMYLILIEVPHLKQKLKATNLMSLFDCKIGNSDNQVIVSMVERWSTTTHAFYLTCGELGITPKDFTVHNGICIETGEPKGVVVDWEEGKSEAGTSQAGASRGRGVCGEGHLKGMISKVWGFWGSIIEELQEAQSSGT